MNKQDATQCQFYPKLPDYSMKIKYVLCKFGIIQTQGLPLLLGATDQLSIHFSVLAKYFVSIYPMKKCINVYLQIYDKLYQQNLWQKQKEMVPYNQNISVQKTKAPRRTSRTFISLRGKSLCVN